MESPTRMRGVLAPVITPFDSELRPDAARLTKHCRWLLDNDVGLAVFGTNSEANSMSVGEKVALLDALVEAGLPPARMMPGTGCCALTDTVELTRHAMRHRCGGVLMLPPFYYKGVSDDGLFASYSEVIQRVGDARLRIYLYHIPPVSQIAISHALIERLLDAYPEQIAGIKDSSNDWTNMSAMLERFQPRGFNVFTGNEHFLLDTMRMGGAGCISALANVNGGAIARLYREWKSEDAKAQQASLDEVRNAFAKFPMIPALKAAVAAFGKDPVWATVRPPLVALSEEQQEALVNNLPSTLRLVGV